MNDTAIPLYSRISLNRDFPEYRLKRGDVATLVDRVPDPDGIEEGYILEVFNALGESIDVVTVPKSAVAPLRSDEIPQVRSLVETMPSSRSPRQGRPHQTEVFVVRQKGAKKIVRRIVTTRRKSGRMPSK
jgi:hypothetical protein